MSRNRNRQPAAPAASPSEGTTAVLESETVVTPAAPAETEGTDMTTETEKPAESEGTESGSETTGLPVVKYIIDSLAGDNVGHIVSAEVLDFYKTACRRAYDGADVVVASGDFKKCPYCVNGEMSPRKIPATKKENAAKPEPPAAQFASDNDVLEYAIASVLAKQDARDGGPNPTDAARTLAILTAGLDRVKPSVKSGRGHRGTEGPASVSVAGECRGSLGAPVDGSVSTSKGGWTSGTCPVCKRARTYRESGPNVGTLVAHKPEKPEQAKGYAPESESESESPTEGTEPAATEGTEGTESE